MGKKVIRLTEADIEKIVRNVLKEQEQTTPQPQSTILDCPSGGVFKIVGTTLYWANNQNDRFYEIWKADARPTFKFENNRVFPIGYLDLQSRIFSDMSFQYQAMNGAGILPMNYKWSNSVTDSIFFYSIDSEGNIHGDVSTAVKVSKNTVKNLDALGLVMGSDGDLPERSGDGTMIWGDTYVRVNGKVNLIAVRSLGPRLRYSTVQPGTTTRKPKPAVDRLEMALTDMFTFDTIDFVDSAKATGEINNFIGLLKKYAKEFNTEQNNFKNHIVNSAPKVYGYASRDNDPAEKITGKFSPCKGEPTRGDYNKCLSQHRADTVAKLINDGLAGTGMDIFKGVGMGETDKFAPGKKWPEVTDNTQTAPNRRVYTFIPQFTYTVKQ
jgi:hypothetical protein